jgi:A/G-specific adenine glycosylase
VRLLRWFDVHRRDLPWRRHRDPWAIWVSEIMLQQTRVEAVKAAFERFVRRFPTPASFAAAGDDELLLAWRGLGYYRRARLLREGARHVVARHAGRVPADLAALAELPGVGPYTFGALASIAFGHAEIAVDGNVERVASRHRGIRTEVRSSPARAAIRGFVSAWLERSRPGDFNQALMELGATVCSPSSPACDRCPVQSDCVASAAGLVHELPLRRQRRAVASVSARVALIVGSRGALGARIGAGEPNAGQIELPGAGMLVDAEPDALAGMLRRRFGAKVVIGAVVASVRHAITHHRIVVHAHAGAVRDPGALAWYAIDDTTPWTTPSRKVFRAALGAAGALQA